MNGVTNPEFPSTHPRQVFYENLSSGSTLVWYSETSTDRAILRYALRLLGIDYVDLKVSEYGYGVANDESVVLTTLRGPKGSAVCVLPVSEIGVERLNMAIQTEHDETMDALSRGEYTGNDGDAMHAVLRAGMLDPDWEGSPVIDIIEAADLTHITGIGLATD